MPIDSPRTTRLRRAGAALAATAAVGASLLMVAPAAHAAEDVITVTNNDRCDAADPTGKTGLPGSLQEALELANASTNPDGVKIVFDAAIAAEINFDGPTCKMWDQPIGAVGSDQMPGALGARFLIDSQVPVSIDFTNLPGISTTTDADFAGIYVKSDNVTLENLDHLKAGAAALAIGGTNVTVAGFMIDDPGSSVSEMGVALLDGATDVTVRDSSIYSQWWASIVVDGSHLPANAATVNNIVVDNVDSRGVESAYGHIDIEDNAVVNGLTVTNSLFGALGAETSTTHGVSINPGATINDLVYSGNTVERGAGAEMNVFFLWGAAELNNTVIDGNTFQGLDGQPLSRIIGGAASTWNGLEYTNNTAEYTRGILMTGDTVTDAVFDGNTFVNTREPAGAAIQLWGTLSNVAVSNNFLDTPWAVDGIRVQSATPVENVVIENNTIHDFYADGSRSAIAIIAPGTPGLDSVVRGNELIQHLNRGNGTDLPTTLANHWAVYVWLESSAASGNDSTGWSVLDNTVDGFGGNPAIASQGPITNNAIGKTLIVGNTFGENTRGSFATETENGGLWFLWNDHGLANNRVQTFRAEQVAFDGTNAHFTATQPAPEAGNTAAGTPVALHVYWTAADNAEVYLGELTGVTPGQRVSIPTAETTGYIRVQTVDASGFTSQYSSIDQNVVVTPAAPAVTETGETTAKGTGQPGATVKVRNAADAVVAQSVVASDGKWSVSGLSCGTAYTATQSVLELQSARTNLNTTACPTPGGGGTGGGGTGGTGGQGGSLADTGGADLGGFVAGGIALLVLGGGALMFARRRTARAE